MSTADERLGRMANDIAANVRSGRTTDEAAKAIAGHLQRFWTPGMRERLLELCADGSSVLEAEVLLAAKHLGK